MSDGIISMASKFKRGNGASPEVFTQIGEVLSYPLPPLDTDEIDFTHLNSTGGYREYKQGFRDSGAIDVPMHFILDDFDDLLNDYESGDERNYQIILADTNEATLEFTAWVKSLKGEVEAPGGKVLMTPTFRITGGVSLSS